MSRNRPNIAVAVTLAAVAQGACLSTSPSTTRAATARYLTTDSSAYVARIRDQIWNQPRYEFSVIATYRNLGSKPLYLGRCFPNSPVPMYGVSRADGARGPKSGYDPVWACVGHNRQFRLNPGEQRVDTLRIVGPNGFDHFTHQPSGPVEGEFRLYYYVDGCTGSNPCPVADAIRTSNTFRVRTPPSKA